MGYAPAGCHPFVQAARSGGPLLPNPFHRVALIAYSLPQFDAAGVARALIPRQWGPAFRPFSVTRRAPRRTSYQARNLQRTRLVPAPITHHRRRRSHFLGRICTMRGSNSLRFWKERRRSGRRSRAPSESRLGDRPARSQNWPVEQSGLGLHVAAGSCWSERRALRRPHLGSGGALHTTSIDPYRS